MANYLELFSSRCFRLKVRCPIPTASEGRHVQFLQERRADTTNSAQQTAARPAKDLRDFPETKRKDTPLTRVLTCPAGRGKWAEERDSFLESLA